MLQKLRRNLFRYIYASAKNVIQFILMQLQYKNINEQVSTPSMYSWIVKIGFSNIGILYCDDRIFLNNKKLNSQHFVNACDKPKHFPLLKISTIFGIFMMNEQQLFRIRKNYYYLMYILTYNKLLTFLLSKTFFNKGTFN